jgi:uncharacterized protein YajQ (UPF0234 family)
VPTLIKTRFWYGQLTLPSEQVATLPFNEHGGLWLGVNHKTVANRYGLALEKQFSDEGDFRSLFPHLSQHSFVENSLTIRFDASMKADLFPAHELAFHTLSTELPAGGFLGVVPKLGLEAYAKTEEQLNSRLEDNIRLEFTREKRFSDVRLMLPNFWPFAEKFGYTDIDISVLDPKELDEKQKHQKKPLLPDVASKMVGSAAKVIELGSCLKQLQRNLDGEFPQSVIVVADGGRGKTALINDFVHRAMKAKKWAYWKTTAAKMITRLTGESSWQKQLSLLCQELQDQPVILYVDHLWSLFEVGQYSGNQVSMGEYLREKLQRGEILLLAECTEAELAKIDVRSPNYTALFQLVRLPEHSAEKSKDIIQQSVIQLSKLHEVDIDSSAIDEIIQLTDRFMPYSGLPGKPIRFLESLILQMRGEPECISHTQVIRAFCEETGMPEFMLNSEQELKYSAINQYFSGRLFGQGKAIDILSHVLLSVKASVNKREKPIATLMFVGSTGVGKTELAKALAAYLYGDERRMIRLDMSEYQSLSSVMRLIGDVGGDGVLTRQVRQQPFSVVLFDELEKADSRFYDLLLQILGEGRLTDHQGQVVNFCSTVIIMTSNIGAKSFSQNGLGFVGSKGEDHSHSYFTEAVQKFFRPELFNRLDFIVPFNQLGKKQRKPIILRELEKLKQREGLLRRNVSFSIEDQVVDWVSEQIEHAKYGARHLQRVLAQSVVNPMARKLSGYRYDEALSLHICVQEQQIRVTVARIDDAEQHMQVTEKSQCLAQLNQFSRARRHTRLLCDGPVYLDLVARKTRCLAKQKKLKEAFWKEATLVAELTQLESLLKSVDDLSEQVIEAEMLMMQQLSGHAEAALILDYVNWQKQWLQLRESLLVEVNPEYEYCSMGLYGAEKTLDDILQVYQVIADAQGYVLQLKDVWWDEAGQKYQRVDSAQRALSEKKYSVRVGYVWQIKSAGSALFLQPENGVSRYLSANDKYLNYFVDVVVGTLSSLVTPDNVHRKSFYEDKPVRRTYRNGLVEDKVYRLKTTPLQNGSLQSVLHAKYLSALDQIMLQRGQ